MKTVITKIHVNVLNLDKMNNKMQTITNLGQMRGRRKRKYAAFHIFENRESMDTAKH